MFGIGLLRSLTQLDDLRLQLSAATLERTSAWLRWSLIEKTLSQLADGCVYESGETIGRD